MSNNECKTAYGLQQAMNYDTERFSTRGGRKIHEIEMNHLKAAIRTVSIGKIYFKILEVGCGTGRLLIELTKANFKVDGIDASSCMLDQCNKINGGRFPDIKLAVGEAAQIPYPANSYYFVYAIRLINQTESSEYALKVISDMIRVAEPEGYILVEFVNLFRPRLGRGKYSGIRLRPKSVIEHAKEQRAKLIWFRGAFFLGMTFYNITPDFLIGFASTVDSVLSKMLPNLCSRCYTLFRKEKA